MCAGRVNFSVFAKGNQAVQLFLFDHPDDAQPSRTITLDPVSNRSRHYWHVFVPGIEVGQIYGYRVERVAPERGLRFDPRKVLLDPYGRAIARPANYSRAAASTRGDNSATALTSVVTDVSRYDWEGDEPLRRPFSRTVIYEMYVAGFTKHPDSGVDPAKRATYAGLIDKIPYLQDLSVTAVEFQPVFQFDEEDVPAGLTNYWDIHRSPSLFLNSDIVCAVIHWLCLASSGIWLKRCTVQGIEVILDVVQSYRRRCSLPAELYPRSAAQGRTGGEEYIKKNILPYTRLGRLIEPSEIAEAICFLISNSEVSGQLWADAGWHPPF